MNMRSARNHGEALAEQCNCVRPPVDVDRVARKLGLRIACADLGDGVSGVLISKGDSSDVIVQESDPPNRRRFTIAHEIGHFVLRHQFEPGEHVHVDRGHLITLRNSRSSTGEDAKEIEANQFAAALLMPSKLIAARIKKLGVRSLLDYHVTLLAKEFQVSEQAMTIRLSTLGYL
jgi:Zn-dependent peptidase ImmA (M78 family)